MKTILSLFLVCMVSCVLYISTAVADILVFSSGHTSSGTVLQTNSDEILLLTRHAAYNFSRSYVKEIKIGSKEAAYPPNTNRFFDFERSILALSKQPWATNITPIPATVIDKGILSNVPYSSLTCGKNYEINIYGDLDHPAGIEIGFYKVLVDDKSRQSNCIKFISDLLAQATDKALVQALDPAKDIKTLDDLTFEITPPSSDDSYNGWWVSVYSEKQLNLARASDAEMKDISISKTDVAKQSSAGDSSQWSADELKLARVPVPATITFTNKSGEVISNAAVQICEPGVSLIWKSDSGASLIKLADLPEDLRNRFGYDPVKAKASDTLEKENKDKLRQAYAAQAAQAALVAQQTKAAQAALEAQQAKAAKPAESSGGLEYQFSGNYSGGGSVYVHGYYRKDGTYVSGHIRR